MSIIVDRSDESSQGLGSRARLHKRTKSLAREAVYQSINNGNIADIGKGGIDVIVPKRDLSEPFFHHKKSGTEEIVISGNNSEMLRFRVGDRLKRPEAGGGGGKGSDASEDGHGEDSFVYHLSQDEFLDILYEDLELPNLSKEGGEDTARMAPERAGFVNEGPYNRLSFVRSKQKKIGREGAMNRETLQRILDLMQEEKAILSVYGNIPPVVDTDIAFKDMSAKAKIAVLHQEIDLLEKANLHKITAWDQGRIAEIRDELQPLETRRGFVERWNERMDLNFRNVEQRPQPVSKAVVFLLMDVSGSMTEEMKSNAKLFFSLLYFFIKRKYEKVELRFIRHTHEAKEVDEKEFFESKETGGTTVSTALVKAIEIQEKHYPLSDWNIYVAQASDGDNLAGDKQKTQECARTLLTMLQGFFHLEVGNSTANKKTDLWATYEPLADQHPDRFWMQKAQTRADVFPVFRRFLSRRDKPATATYAAALTHG